MLYWVLLLVYVPRTTLYWVLLLVYVPRATLYWVLLLVYVGPPATHYWLLLLVYEGPRTTHFAGYCCGLYKVLGSTLYWASLSLIWGAFINGFKIILFNATNWNFQIMDYRSPPTKLPPNTRRSS
jgi:hypothetical protein